MSWPIRSSSGTRTASSDRDRSAYRLRGELTRPNLVETLCTYVAMSPVADLETIEAIKRVKYRYLRALDTKHWDDFADTLTEDIVGDYGSSMGKEHHFTNRDELVEFMRTSMPANVITEHRVTHPEITVVDEDQAEGIWYLQDKVIVAEFNFMLFGAAFYHDRYRKTEDGWKICATGYQRTYDATQSLEGTNFKITPGAALA